MAEKIPAEELREKNPNELNRIKNDLNRELMEAVTPQRGDGAKNPPQPQESIGTIKRNIARVKTVLNEKLDSQVN